jgi:hypothetical protein
MYAVKQGKKYNGVVYDTINANIIQHHEQYGETLVLVESLTNKGTDDAPKWVAVELPNKQRMMDIKARLSAIDAESVRPLRAKLSGTDTEQDRARLAALDDEAETLRSELRELKQ